MPKFFRSLRQSLIENGQFKKYLTYAAGEILLVMIGILLALQVNDWNDRRKEYALEKSYYCKLNEDLVQDVLQIDKMILENDERIKQCNTLLHLLQLDKPDPPKVLQAIVGSISKTTFTFKVSTAAFEDLKSSGNLRILQDHAIKDSLIRYYATMVGYTDVIDVNSHYTVELYYDRSMDFMEKGWQYNKYARDEIDTTQVNLKALDTGRFPSEKTRKRMLSDAIFYLTTNARKKMWYTIMKGDVKRMQAQMQQKCN